MDLTPTFARIQDQEEASLEGQMLQGGFFKGFKGSLGKLVKYHRKVPRGDASATLRYVSTEAIQEVTEIFILADIGRRIS